MQHDDIIYGAPEQVALVRRAQALHRLLIDEPRATYQGRTVSWLADGPDEADRVIDLCRLQGYSSAQFTPRETSPAFLRAFEDAGLTPIEWEQYHGRKAALSASHAFLKDFTPPAGLRLQRVDGNTSDDHIHALCAMSLKSGVLQVPGSVMRGNDLRGATIYVETDAGEVVASGGGFMAYHRDSPRHDEAFWGMLATDKSWRGKRLACWVGAAVISALAEEFGARGFSSGVKADNASSQAMCNRLGITDSGMVYAGAVDPDLMGSTSPTR